MAKINQSMVKTVNANQSRIDVVNDTNNWKGKRNIKKSKTGNRQLGKYPYAYCKMEGH